jgi:TonB family protein
MASLPRNTVASGVKVSAGNDTNGFNITGALRGRGIVSKALPQYEQDARVALRFRVDYSGRVLEGVLVEISSGSPSFDQRVIAALKQWQFVPLGAGRTNEVQEGVITFLFKGV